MTYELITVTTQARVGIVTLNRPKQLNALNDQLMDEMGKALKAFDTDENIGCMILTGSEKAFAAGADIGAMAKYSFADAYKGDYITRNWEQIRNIRKPVIAAVSGFALGGGCELAMACHIRIASPNAKFGQPEVNLGIIPGYGGTQRLVQLVGKGRALELMMTADMIGAEEAFRLGLVNSVVPAGEEVASATALLEKIATKAPIAIAKVIESVNAYFEAGTDGFAKEVAAFGECCATDDFREGAAAFVEKRKADFKGK